MNKTTLNTDTKILVDTLVEISKSGFSGTMTDLMTKLSQSGLSPAKTASQLRTVINTIIHKVRNKKVSVKFIRSNDRKRTRLVYIKPSKKAKA